MSRTKPKQNQIFFVSYIVLLIYFSGNMPANMLLHAGCVSLALGIRTWQKCAIVSHRGHCHIIINFHRRNMIRVINENIAMNSISSSLQS